MNFQEGEFIYINKPYRMSSFGALAFVRTRLSKALHSDIMTSWEAFEEDAIVAI